MCCAQAQRCLVMQAFISNFILAGELASSCVASQGASSADIQALRTDVQVVHLHTADESDVANAD